MTYDADGAGRCSNDPVANVLSSMEREGDIFDSADISIGSFVRHSTDDGNATTNVCKRMCHSGT